MDVLIGIGCAVGVIWGVVWGFFAVLGDSKEQFIMAFGLTVGSLGFGIDAATELGFVASMGIAMIVVAGGVIWSFK